MTETSVENIQNMTIYIDGPSVSHNGHRETSASSSGKNMKVDEALQCRSEILNHHRINIVSPKRGRGRPRKKKILETNSDSLQLDFDLKESHSFMTDKNRRLRKRITSRPGQFNKYSDFVIPKAIKIHTVSGEIQESHNLEENTLKTLSSSVLDSHTDNTKHVRLVSNVLLNKHTGDTSNTEMEDDIEILSSEPENDGSLMSEDNMSLSERKLKIEKVFYGFNTDSNNCTVSVEDGKSYNAIKRQQNVRDVRLKVSSTNSNNNKTAIERQRKAKLAAISGVYMSTYYKKLNSYGKTKNPGKAQLSNGNMKKLSYYQRKKLLIQQKSGCPVGSINRTKKVTGPWKVKNHKQKETNGMLSVLPKRKVGRPSKVEILKRERLLALSQKKAHAITVSPKVVVSASSFSKPKMHSPKRLNVLNSPRLPRNNTSSLRDGDPEDVNEDSVTSCNAYITRSSKRHSVFNLSSEMENCYKPPKLLISKSQTINSISHVVGMESNGIYDICIEPQSWCHNENKSDPNHESHSTNQAHPNYFSLEVMKEISKHLEHAENSKAKLVLLRSEGTIFSLGLDIKEVMSYTRPQDIFDQLRKMVESFIRFPKPIVVTVQGQCMSLGASILGLCDLVIASDKASIQMPYTLQGVTPDACSTYLLPTIVGSQQASNLFYGNKMVSAAEAHRIGYFTEVVGHDMLMENVMNHVNNIRSAALLSLVATKKLLRAPHIAQLIYVNDCEIRSLTSCLKDPQCRFNMQSFLKM